MGQGKRSVSHLANATQERRVLQVGQNRRVPRCFVDDVRGRRVRKVIEAPDVGRDRQNAARLQFLKCTRRDEAVDAHGTPSLLGQPTIHLDQDRNAVERDAHALETYPVRGMSRVTKHRVCVAEYKFPNRLIDFVVGPVVLGNDIPAQVKRNTLERLGHPLV